MLAAKVPAAERPGFINGELWSIHNSLAAGEGINEGIRQFTISCQNLRQQVSAYVGASNDTDRARIGQEINQTLRAINDPQPVELTNGGYGPKPPAFDTSVIGPILAISNLAQTERKSNLDQLLQGAAHKPAWLDIPESRDNPKGDRVNNFYALVTSIVGQEGLRELAEGIDYLTEECPLLTDDSADEFTQFGKYNLEDFKKIGTASKAALLRAEMRPEDKEAQSTVDRYIADHFLPDASTGRGTSYFDVRKAASKRPSPELIANADQNYVNSIKSDFKTLFREANDRTVGFTNKDGIQKLMHAGAKLKDTTANPLADKYFYDNPLPFMSPEQSGKTAKRFFHGVSDFLDQGLVGSLGSIAGTVLKGATYLAIGIGVFIGAGAALGLVGGLVANGLSFAAIGGAFNGGMAVLSTVGAVAGNMFGAVAATAAAFGSASPVIQAAVTTMAAVGALAGGVMLAVPEWSTLKTRFHNFWESHLSEGPRAQAKEAGLAMADEAFDYLKDASAPIDRLAALADQDTGLFKAVVADMVEESPQLFCGTSVDPTDRTITLPSGETIEVTHQEAAKAKAQIVADKLYDKLDSLQGRDKVRLIHTVLSFAKGDNQVYNNMSKWYSPTGRIMARRKCGLPDFRIDDNGNSKLDFNDLEPSIIEMHQFVGKTARASIQEIDNLINGFDTQHSMGLNIEHLISQEHVDQTLFAAKSAMRIYSAIEEKMEAGSALNLDGIGMHPWWRTKLNHAQSIPLIKTGRETAEQALAVDFALNSLAVSFIEIKNIADHVINSNGRGPEEAEQMLYALKGFNKALIGAAAAGANLKSIYMPPQLIREVCGAEHMHEKMHFGDIASVCLGKIYDLRQGRQNKLGGRDKYALSFLKLSDRQLTIGQHQVKCSDEVRAKMGQEMLFASSAVGSIVGSMNKEFDKDGAELKRAQAKGEKLGPVRFCIHHFMEFFTGRSPFAMDYGNMRITHPDSPASHGGYAEGLTSNLLWANHMDETAAFVTNMQHEYGRDIKPGNIWENFSDLMFPNLSKPERINSGINSEEQQRDMVAFYQQCLDQELPDNAGAHPDEMMNYDMASIATSPSRPSNLNGPTPDGSTPTDYISRELSDLLAMSGGRSSS